MYVHCSTKTTPNRSPLCVSAQIPRWKLQWPEHFKVSYLHHELLAQYNDVGQTNNSRLMRAWERSLPIKNLSTWSNCSLSAISKVSTCKQARGVSSFHDSFHRRTELLFLFVPQSQKGRWWRFSLEFPKGLLWILDRDKPACLVTTKTKHDQDKEEQNLFSSSKLPLRKIGRLAGLVDLYQGC